MDKEVIVQINVPHSQSELFVNLKQLINALQLDPDLATVNTEQLPRIFQMLYVCSGCDYISYFAGAGKAAFFTGFFQHAAFITGSKIVGELSSTGDVSNNYLSFLRLIGTLYFKKHYSAVVSLRSTETPQQLFNSKQSPTGAPKQQHEQWYNDIRAIVSERITNEEERMPSLTSMWRHWLRSCWIADLYQSAHEQDPFARLPDPTQSGWKYENNDYKIDWECPKVQDQVRSTIDFLTKGCHCKKGCQTTRCSCFKRGSTCGPGCQCQNCKTNRLMETQKQTVKVAVNLKTVVYKLK